MIRKLFIQKIGRVEDLEDNTKALSDEIINKYKLDKNNEIINYDSNLEMINDLYNKKIDYVILPTNYSDIYGTTEEVEDIIKELVTVDTSQKEVTKEEVKLSGSSKDVTESFTLLLIGIDSTVDGLEKATDSFNGDSLILITFNPKTFTATMLSIPRDSYVPITCMNNVDNKITHSSGHGGTKCVKSTIEKFLDIKVDYYVKINFTGVVELVEALNGVEIDVPYNLCEQNSKREFGNNIVYIKKGLQTLNGEQALAYARNRKSNSQYCSKEWTQGERSDFIRAAHQQEVIQAILDKIKKLSSINELEDILKVISKNIDTNMDNSKIFSFYNVFKDVLLSSSNDKALSIQKLYLDGTGQMIYDERSKLVLWDYILNQKSLAAVKKAMKDNLSGAKQELIKTFSYSIDASNNDVTLKIEYVKDSKSAEGSVIFQDYPESKRIDLIPNKTVTIKVVKNNDSSSTTEKIDCLKETSNSVCQVPNFIGRSKSNVVAWKNSISNDIDVSFEYKESDELPGLILEQSVEAKTSVKDMINKKTTLVITMAQAKKTDNKDDNQNTGTGNENNNNNNETPGENSGGNTENGDNSGNNSGSNQGGNDNPPPVNDDNTENNNNNNNSDGNNKDNEDSNGTE